MVCWIFGIDSVMYDFFVGYVELLFVFGGEGFWFCDGLEKE